MAAVTIRQIVQDTDGDFFPDRLGDTVAVRGVITADPVQFGDDASFTYMQDATAGISLFTSLPGMMASLSPGDSVEVRGVVGQFQGAEHVAVERVERLGRTAVPEPREVLAAEARGERFAGQLVRLEGALRIGDDQSEWAVAVLEDRSGTIQVLLSSALLTNPDVVERLDRGGSARVTGIVGQSAGGTQPNDGYFVMPRGVDDIAFAPVPPYGAIGSAVVVLAFLAVLGWRRSAVRRAERLERLGRELERSRNAIEEREALLRSLVENAADTVAVIDAAGTIVYQSPSVRRMLGRAPDELVGERLQDMVDPRDRATVTELLATLSGTDGTTREVEVRVQAGDGSSRSLEIYATSRLGDPAVEGIVCNARDVTEHRTLEEQVRQTDRLEVVGRLAGGIAHDFNNVLTVLRGNAAMALDALPTATPGREDVQEVVRAAERASALTRQLLAFSRQQVLNPRVVSPVTIVRDIVPMIRRLIGEDVELQTNLQSDPMPIRVDPTQVEQVLMNLVVNARDAMPEGGLLTLELTNETVSETAGSDTGPDRIEAGEYVRLTVRDTGIGIPEDVLTHIFEPFYTTKEQGKGTGLGLATSYGIIRQSGGHLLAGNRAGQGAWFDVYFPAVDADVEGDDAPAPTPEAARQSVQGDVVLLVEDEAPVRRLARRVLERHYEVLEADTPKAALDLAYRNRGSIDLLVTDVVMPEMSGPEVATAIRELDSDVPTLFISGYTDDEVVRHGVVAGEAKFLQKPFTPAEFLQAVQVALGRNSDRALGPTRSVVGREGQSSSVAD